MPAPSDLVLAIDQGTSGTTCLLVRPDGTVVRRAYREVAVSYPQPGWVEQDPEQLWSSALDAAREVLDGEGAAAVGITNQRETVVVFERETLRPVAPAIVWQCRRSGAICDEHRAAGHEPEIRRRTGLLLDPYFTATKLEWLLRDRPELRRRAEAGELCAGTVDAWLMARLTNGTAIVTDPGNASRTLLYDIHARDWSDELCAMFSVPRSLLPDIGPSSGRLGVSAAEHLGAPLPLSGIAGDQQAALFGQACLRAGMSKNTYGTGSFVLVNVGNNAPEAPKGLLATVAWRIGGTDTYALEGSIFVTGAAIKWLRDGLGLIDRADEVGPLFDSVPDSNGCTFVPALAGLGAPYWDPGARGALLGITAGVTRAHVARAVVEAMAFRTRDVVEAMEDAAGIRFEELRVDGGASVMDGLCQFQADQLGIAVARARSAETTGIGAALLAALGEGLIASPGELETSWTPGRRFEPGEPGVRPAPAYAVWRDAVSRVRTTAVRPEAAAALPA